MSAPPISRLVGERQVSVVRDAAAVWRVLDDDPIESCMVAARVADHGIDPNAIGGELWTRRGAHESLCFAGANLIPLRGGPIDLNAFADVAMSTRRDGVRHWSAGPTWCCRCGSGSSRCGVRRGMSATTNR